MESEVTKVERLSNEELLKIYYEALENVNDIKKNIFLNCINLTAEFSLGLYSIRSYEYSYDIEKTWLVPLFISAILACKTISDLIDSNIKYQKLKDNDDYNKIINEVRIRRLY